MSENFIERKFERMQDPKSLKELWRHIRCFDLRLVRRWFRLWYQKITTGIDDSETWSFDITLADFIANGLTQLEKQIKNANCCPDRSKSYPEYFDDIHIVKLYFRLIVIAATAVDENHENKAREMLDVIDREEIFMKLAKLYPHLWW